MKSTARFVQLAQMVKRQIENPLDRPWTKSLDHNLVDQLNNEAKKCLGLAGPILVFCEETQDKNGPRLIDSCRVERPGQNQDPIIVPICQRTKCPKSGSWIPKIIHRESHERISIVLQQWIDYCKLNDQPPTVEEIFRAHMNAPGNATEKEKAVQTLINRSEYKNWGSVKAMAHKLKITQKSLRQAQPKK